MRIHFDEQLEQLNKEIISMGTLVEQAIEMAVDALIKQDVEKAKKAMDFDEEVDRKEKIIENLCLRLLLQQQPVARDLRIISAALKMITEIMPQIYPIWPSPFLPCRILSSLPISSRWQKKPCSC